MGRERKVTLGTAFVAMVAMLALSCSGNQDEGETSDPQRFEQTSSAFASTTKSAPISWPAASSGSSVSAKTSWSKRPPTTPTVTPTTRTGCKSARCECE